MPALASAEPLASDRFELELPSGCVLTASGVEPTSLADGFGTIVEEIILNVVKDMQHNGISTNLEQPMPAEAILAS